MREARAAEIDVIDVRRDSDIADLDEKARLKAAELEDEEEIPRRAIIRNDWVAIGEKRDTVAPEADKRKREINKKYDEIMVKRKSLLAQQQNLRPSKTRRTTSEQMKSAICRSKAALDNDQPAREARSTAGVGRDMSKITSEFGESQKPLVDYNSSTSSLSEGTEVVTVHSDSGNKSVDAVTSESEDEEEESQDDTSSVGSSKSENEDTIKVPVDSRIESLKKLLQRN